MLTNWSFKIFQRLFSSTKDFKERVQGLCAGRFYIEKSCFWTGSLKFWELLKKPLLRTSSRVYPFNIFWRCNCPWHGSDCFGIGIYFGCSKTLCSRIGRRDKKDHIRMLSNRAHDKHNGYLRVLGVRPIVPLPDGSCEEVKKFYVLIPVKSVVKHHVECIQTLLNLQTSTWNDFLLKRMLYCNL